MIETERERIQKLEAILKRVDKDLSMMHTTAVEKGFPATASLVDMMRTKIKEGLAELQALREKVERI